MSEKIDYQEVMIRMKMDVDYIAEDAYQRGIEDGQNETWEAAKKMLCMSTERIEECFDVDESTIWLFYHMNVAEAIAKLKAYEEKQKADDKIKVGDEVTHKSDSLAWTAVCIQIDEDGRHMNLMGHTGAVGYYLVDAFKKTGRHFDIASILEEVKGDNESNISRH